MSGSNIWGAVAAIGGLLGGVAAVAGLVGLNTQGAPPASVTAPTAQVAASSEHVAPAAEPASATQAQIPASGIWTVVIMCREGSAVREVDARFDDGVYRRNFNGGETNLSMYLIGSTEVRVVGNIQFDAAGAVYPVDARGAGNGGSFSGAATYGASSDCPFNATRQSD